MAAANVVFELLNAQSNCSLQGKGEETPQKAWDGKGPGRLCFEASVLNTNPNVVQCAEESHICSQKQQHERPYQVLTVPANV